MAKGSGDKRGKGPFCSKEWWKPFSLFAGWLSCDMAACHMTQPGHMMARPSYPGATPHLPLPSCLAELGALPTGGEALAKALETTKECDGCYAESGDFKPLLKISNPAGVVISQLQHYMTKPNKK